MLRLQVSHYVFSCRDFLRYIRRWMHATTFLQRGIFTDCSDSVWRQVTNRCLPLKRLARDSCCCFANICNNLLPFNVASSSWQQSLRSGRATNSCRLERHSKHTMDLFLKLFTERGYTRCPSIGRVPNFQQQSLVAQIGPSYIHVSAIHRRCHFQNYINNYNLRSQRFPFQRPLGW